MAAVKQEEPSPDFTGRVMERLAALEQSAGGTGGSRIPERSGEERPRRFIFRPELANALVATAATYVFISSGFLNAVFSLDRGLVEYEVYSKVQIVMGWVGQLSQALH